MSYSLVDVLYAYAKSTSTPSESQAATTSAEAQTPPTLIPPRVAVEAAISENTNAARTTAVIFLRTTKPSFSWNVPDRYRETLGGT